MGQRKEKLNVEGVENSSEDLGKIVTVGDVIEYIESQQN